jgi:VanZ family protein
VTGSVAATTRLLVAAALALPLVALAFGLPSHPRILAVLNNAAHGPLFAALAAVIALLVRDRVRWTARWQLLAAFAIAVTAGGLIELIQPALGRSRELADLWTDAAGAAAGLAVLELTRTRRPWIPAAVLGLTTSAIGWPVYDAALAYEERNRQAPALLEISGRSDWYFLWTRGVHATEQRLPGPWRGPGDATSLRVQLDEGKWRTIGHDEPISDWRPFRRLMMDLTNPGPEPLRLTLRVHDGIHNDQATDRFNRRFVLEAATRSVLAIPLADIERAPNGRKLDLSEVTGWMIFAGNDPALARRAFYITRIWLE